mmetsp:Transcript_32352/g.64932  ORF Transcript_32352/g.64932 Transcript_32352/m.64932 type:complete len:139 (+) Transcript_32352:187-603(+)
MQGQFNEVLQHLQSTCSHNIHFAHDSYFASQLTLGELYNITPERECILRALQLAAVSDLIAPVFGTLEHESENCVLGWKAFSVRPHRSREFRRQIQEVYGITDEDGIQDSFLRFRIDPVSSWELSWYGAEGFVCSQPL